MLRSSLAACLSAAVGITNESDVRTPGGCRCTKLGLEQLIVAQTVLSALERFAGST